jgi:Planctomycete cytochrome C
MKFSRAPLRFTALFVILCLGSCQHVGQEGSETAPIGPSVLSDAALQEAQSGKVSFTKHIKPVLTANCLPCHDGKTVGPPFLLTNREEAFKPGALGSRIQPGKPDQSLLFLNPRGTHKAINVMPPVGNRLTSAELNVLRRWIEQGADWPSGAAGRLTRAE